MEKIIVVKSQWDLNSGLRNDRGFAGETLAAAPQRQLETELAIQPVRAFQNFEDKYLVNY